VYAKRRFGRYLYLLDILVRRMCNNLRRNTVPAASNAHYSQSTFAAAAASYQSHNDIKLCPSAAQT